MVDHICLLGRQTLIFLCFVPFRMQAGQWGNTHNHMVFPVVRRLICLAFFFELNIFFALNMAGKTTDMFGHCLYIHKVQADIN